ncbi:MAG TPA: hypothetical protein VH309_01295, partial [Elusimicrobiota bacterium]|nr:hypothetical protein [Elusimicrobiota bacterium]
MVRRASRRLGAVALVFSLAAVARGAVPLLIVPEEAGGAGSISALAPVWQASLTSYLASPAPDFATVKAALASLESLDTSDPRIQAQLRPLAAQLQASAARLAVQPPSPAATEAELQAASSKLRLLNTPALRNLLGGEEAQSRVGVAAWAYNRSLWDGALDRGGRAAAVAAALAAPAAPASAEAAAARLPPSAKVRVVDGDVMKVKADAVAASIECGGFCGSPINAALRGSVGDALAGRELSDGRTLTVPARPGEARNFVLVVDDQKLPLREVVARALHEAEKSGFTSVALPALRTGYAFGAVETTQAQVVGELAAGAARFLSESRGALTDI